VPRPRIVVDRDVCIGAGSCVSRRPRTFDLDDDGLVVLLDAGAGSPEQLEEAEGNCPSGAIRLEPAD
jgi:ferredoxin